MTTLTINGKKYGKGKGSLTESLFNAGGTNDGYYHKTAGKIILYNAKDLPFVAVITRDARPFMVTCHRVDSGRIRYMFAMCSLDEKILGIENYTNSMDLANYIVSHAQ